MPRERRSFLALLGLAATSGCVTRARSGDPNGSRGGTASGGPPATSGPRRSVAIEDVDEPPAASPVSLAVSVSRSTVTAAETARLDLTVTNDGPERFVRPGSGKCAPLNRRGGRSTDDALWLIQPDTPGMNYLGEEPMREATRWSIRSDADGPPPGLVFFDYRCSPRLYGAGESVTTTYRLWDGPADGYLPTGTHRFEVPVEVRTVDDPECPTCGDREAEFAWGFELAVERP